jgi:hypothetical protein
MENTDEIFKQMEFHAFLALQLHTSFTSSGNHANANLDTKRKTSILP